MSQATHQRAAAVGRPARGASLRAVPAAVGRSGNAVFAVVCMGLLAVGLVALLLLNTALASGAFTLQTLTETSRALTNEEHDLRETVESRSSSAALAQRAVQMGMVPARSMAFLRLSDGAILGVATPARAEPFVVVTTPRPAPPAPAPEAAPVPEGAAPTAGPTGATDPGADAPAEAAPEPTAAPAAPGASASAQPAPATPAAPGASASAQPGPATPEAP